jgi:hypothetical protein
MVRVNSRPFLNAGFVYWSGTKSRLRWRSRSEHGLKSMWRNDGRRNHGYDATPEKRNGDECFAGLLQASVDSLPSESLGPLLFRSQTR